MSRKLLISVGLIVLLGGTAFFLNAWRERRLVARWTSDFGRSWDRQLSWRANQDRRQDGLKSIAPVAVKVLQKDLNLDPALPRWATRLPSWLANYLPGTRESGAAILREEAPRSLALLGPLARPVLPDLIRRTNDPRNDYLLAEVALAIGAVGGDSAEAQAALIKLWQHRNRQVAACAAFALWRSQPSDREAQQRIEALINLNPSTMVLLAGPISEMAEAARPLAPAVRHAFEETEHMTEKINEARVLWRITGDPQPAIGLVKFLIEQYDGAATNQIDRAAPARTRGQLVSASLVFEDIPECRAALRPVLEKFRTSQKGIERSSGEFGLAEFAKIEAEQARKGTRVPR